MHNTKRAVAGRAVLAWLLALALACGLCPAAAFAGEREGGLLAQEHGQVTAQMGVYGPVAVDGGAELRAWYPAHEWTGDAGSTVADMAQALFEKSGLEASYDPNGAYGFYLESITGPDGTVYAYDATSGEYWALYVNGQAATVGASGIELAPGDAVSWVYCTGESTMPDVDGDLMLDRTAPLPSFEADWALNGGAFAGQASSSLPTMAASSDLSWKRSLVDVSDGASASISDLIVVDDAVYVASSTARWYQAEDGSWASETTDAVLRAYDAEDGTLLRETVLPGSLDSSACRLAYADGVVAVPLSGGSLVGVAADTLSARWYVPTALEGAQSLNATAAGNGSFLFSYSQLDGTYHASASRTLSVDAQTGAIEWEVDDLEDGMYWGGFALVGGYAVMGTDAGLLKAIDLSDGTVVSTLDCGDAVRSVPTVYDGSSVVFTTADGTFHKANVSASGRLSAAGSVPFAASSTSTPSLVEGRAVVGGMTEDFKGVLAAVDVDSMKLVSTWGVDAEPKGRAVTAIGFDGAAYAYFTCNAQPGSLFGVEVAEGTEPFEVCVPEGAERNWCMASPVSDNDGRLFYTNDAGVLFAVDYDRACGFEDVDAQGWYVLSGDFERAVSSGLMKGVGPTSFDPDRAMTRAEVVTVLHRAAGSPSADVSKLSFADVPKVGDVFYREALAWAVENEVAFGYGEGDLFGPDDLVTREQLAAFLGRYAVSCGKGDLVENADAAAFESLPDHETVSPWFADTAYLAWCCDEEIISGSLKDGTAYLDPQGFALRCMMAKMIVRTVDALS